MKVIEYGDPEAEILLLQPIGEQDLAGTEREIALLSELSEQKFRWLGFRVNNWNKDLSPWEAPAVFGKEAFGSGARETLTEILNDCGDKNKSYYLGGYSLAGLFSLWAAYQTDCFRGIAAVSPSVWFPGYDEYTAGNERKTGSIYLSLGDREENTRNPVMRTVGDKIRTLYAELKAQNADCVLEWNPGNHFQEPERRMALGFAWLLNRR